MTRRGIPRLYSLPPTLPARTSPPLPSPPFRATRRGFSVRGTGAVWWCLMASWLLAQGGGGEARRGLEDTAGDLLRAGWRGLAVWTAHFGAACQNCTRRSPNGPGRTRPAAMESSSPGRSRVRGARLATARRAPPHAARSRPSLAWGRAADGRHAAGCGRNVVRRPGFGYPPLYLP